MRLSGAIYRDKKTARDFLAVYGKVHDVMVQPFPMDKFTDNIIHLTYSKGKVEGSVDIYPLADGERPPRTVNTNKLFKIDGSFCNIDLGKESLLRARRTKLREYQKIYDIGAQVSARIPMDLSTRLLDAGTLDVLFFCGERVAKTSRGGEINYVDEIIPETKIKEVEAKRLIDGGKQWFVPACGLEANLDFGKGCETSWIPFYENAKFDSSTGIFRGFVSIPWAECEYCYAGLRHKSFPKTFHKIDPKQIEELLMGGACLNYDSDEPFGRPVRILRFGKRTEAGSKYFKEKLLTVLEVMAKVGTRGVFPSKLLEFDKELADLFRRTNTVVLYSINSKGFNEFEKGAYLKGSTSESRLENMHKFREKKVNAIPYLHILAGDEPTNEDIKMLERFKKENIPVQLLPLRFQSKNLFKRMTGRKWDYAKNNDGQLMIECMGLEKRGGYEKYEKNLTPIVHQAWRDIIGKNRRGIRMCHHNSKWTYCGGCFQKPGLITKTVQVKKLANGRPGRKKKQKQTKELQKGSLEFYLESINNKSKK